MDKEYIEREAFLKHEQDQYCEGCTRREGKKNGKYVTLYEIGEAPCRACAIDDVMDDVENFPAADVAPVRHGQWQKSYADHESFGVRPFFRYCSNCHETTVYQYRYCPNCGAVMDGGPEE